jgi:hypothetical protein
MRLRCWSDYEKGVLAADDNTRRGREKKAAADYVSAHGVNPAMTILAIHA